MTHDTRGTTRRGVLAAIGGLLATGTVAGAGATDDESESEDVRCASADDVPASDTREVPGTVARIDADSQTMVVRLEDGREVSGSPDVYDIREGDRVTASVRDGRLIGVAGR